MLLSHLNLLATAPGGVARLRELILTLAVQGKLVPQDPSDESASELLARSRAHMQSQMTKGLAKKEKPSIAVAADEMGFLLPNGWQWCRLTDTGEYVNGLAFKPIDQHVTGLPIIRIQNLSGRSRDFNRTQGEFDKSVIVETGDILVSWSATLDAFIWAGERGVLNQHIFRVEPSPAADKNYLYWLLKWAIQKLASSDHAHGLVMAHINRGPFLAMPIALPPLTEQFRIVNRIEELMHLCDALEGKGQLEASQHAQLVSTLLGALTQSETSEQLADNWQRIASHFDLLLNRPEAVDALEQTILQLAVRGLLVPQDPKDAPAGHLLKEINEKKTALMAKKLLKIGLLTEDSKSISNRVNIPETWAWTKGVELLFITKLAGFEYTKHFSLRDEGDIPVVRAQNVRPFSLSTASLKYIDSKTSQVLDRCALTKKALLVTFIGAGIGDVALFEKTERWHLAPNVAKMEPFTGCEDLLDLRYLSCFLNSSYGRQEIFKHIQSTAQPSISMGTIRDIDFPIPPLAEQSRIVSRVEFLLRLCADLRLRLTSSQATQAHLAEALVTDLSTLHCDKVHP